MGKVFRIYIVLAALAILTMAASAQDLGSSNKLFGGAVKTETKPTKRTTTKSRTTKAKPSRSKAKTPVGAETRKTENPAAGQIAESNPAADAAINVRYQKLLADGNAHRDERNYTLAEKAYMEARSVNPADARAAIGLGSLYIDTLQWEDAEKAYRTALQLEPKNAIVHVALSFVLTHPVAAPNLSERYEEAERLARKAVELNARNALAYDQMGVALERRGLIGAETESAYRRAIKLEPSFAPSHAHLGRLMRRRGRAKEADAAYADAVRMAVDVPAMILVADSLQSEQRFSDSVSLLKNALKDDPKNPTALVLLGKALIASGNFAEAERLLITRLAGSTNRFAGFSQLGTLYTRQNKFEMAENALLQAARFAAFFERRELAAQMELVGDGFAKQGNAQAAERVYRKAFALDAGRSALAAKIAKIGRG